MVNIGSTGYIKIGNDYLNPYSIDIIGKNPDGTTHVGYNTLAQGPDGIGPMSDRLSVDTDYFAKCSIAAMQTGGIVDVLSGRISYANIPNTMPHQRCECICSNNHGFNIVA